MNLMIDIWREACRHIEIARSARQVAAILAPRLPLERLLVRALDPERAVATAVAAGAAAASTAPMGETTELGPGRLPRVMTWCRQGQVLLIRAGQRALQPLAALLPADLEGPLQRDLMAAPLRSEHGTAGLLLLEAAAGRRFGQEHERLAALLVEPFATALENDARLRELEALRKAAEADRQSLLTRLGRQAIGDTIVGADAGLRPVLDRAQLVARSDVPVLILGETGTGKEVIARAIHNDSPRAQRPFVRVNCGAIPAELIDSQLFGHERGSFTGATEQRKGWFERADGGTLFLDEIGELPPAAQVRLLRILQDGTFERVGGQDTIKVDIRLVAATHRDLTGMVREGLFREDLWYRVAVFPILLPPLRDRRQDIPELARHFAERAATRFGLPPVAPDPADLAQLGSYHWPGNVRELQAVIDRAAILGQGHQLEIAKALGPGAASPAPGPPPTAGAADDAPVLTLDQAMRQHIERALRTTRGRIEGPHGAARLLSINPHTLRARMRKLQIPWAGFRHGDW